MNSKHTHAGRAVHAHGELKFRLSGRARAQAHVDILTFLDPSVFRGGAASPRATVYRQSIANIVRQDPSLLLEPIPERFPLEKAGCLDRVTSDATWAFNRRNYGHWAARLVDVDLGGVEPLAVLLRAGVHPDDPIWPAGRLLDTEGWAEDPERVALALHYGASSAPQPGQPWRAGPLGRAMAAVGYALRAGTDDETFLAAAEAAKLMYRAGNTQVDSVGEERAGPHSTAFGQLVGLAVDGRRLSPAARRGLDELVTAMIDAGVSMDAPIGMPAVPPVVAALRAGNPQFAADLILRGCAVDDRSIRAASAASGASCFSLEDEAGQAGGAPFVATVTEARMRRAVRAIASVPVQERVAGHRRAAAV